MLAETWTGRTGRLLRKHPADVRELQLYLATAPNNEMYGLYYKPLTTMAEELGRPLEVISASLAVLEGPEINYCAYDYENSWVWVFEMARIQMKLPLLPRDYKVTAANRWYQGLMKNAHLGPYFDRYRDDLHLEPPRREWTSAAPPPAPLAPRPNSEPQPAFGLTVVGVGELARSESTALFERWWMEYPKRVGKKAARNAWNKLNPNAALAERIIEGTRTYKTSRKVLEGFILDPVNYINGERWNDDPREQPRMTKKTLSAFGGEKPGSFLDGM